MSLKLFCGGAHLVSRGSLPSTSFIFAAAESRADLIRMLQVRFGAGRGLSDYIRKYWYEGAWGRAMDGIEQERGLWVQMTSSDPVARIFPGPARVGKRVVRTLKL